MTTQEQAEALAKAVWTVMQQKSNDESLATETMAQAQKMFSEVMLSTIPLVELLECVEALQGMSELCGNYFDESELVCERDREIWKQHLTALANLNTKLKL